jgi:type IV pilus assembly protein PilN
MIRINLLPVRQIKQRIRLRNEVIVFSLALLLLLGVLSIVAGMMSQKISTMQQTITRLNNKKKSYTPILNKIKKLERDKKALEAKIEVIKKLKKKSQITVRVLDEIATITPSNRVWLKRLKQSGTTVNLDGTALDNRTIAQYMKSLKKSPFFSNAVLGSSSQTTVANKKLKSFTLTLTTQVPETAKVEQGKSK